MSRAGSRAALLATAAAAALLAVGCERAAGPEELRARLAALGRPNLVLVVVDTLRADWTTPYGFEQDTAPELARWAERGILFERVRAQSSWTKMSMASLFTSLWPRSHGIREARDGLAEAALTLAEVLHAEGYQTAAVQTNGWLDQSFGFQQGFEHYVFPRSPGPAAARFGRSSVWPHADKVVEEGDRLIDAFARERPFFLYLHFMDVHEYAAPAEFKRFGSDTRGAYLAAIRWVDDALRRVREKLDEAGVLGSTVLVLASDHGETFGENGRHGHAKNVLTAVVHVPLVIRLPFPAEPVRVAAQVRNLDLGPTLLEIAGVPVPEGFEGASLLPLVTGEAAPADRVTYAALGTPLFPDASVQTSMNTGDWTYARNAPAPGQEANGTLRFRPVAPGEEFLFDVGIDPAENVNLIGRESARAEPLRQRLDRHLAEAPATDVRATDVRIDPAIADRLRALGYLQ